MKVLLENPFIDNRGIIQNILNQSINAVAIITSKKGSIRSNHYHKENDHYLYIMSGSLEYYERELDEIGSNIKPIVYKTGEMFYTGPNKVHKVVFLEDTVTICKL